MIYLEESKHLSGYSDVWGRSFYLCGGNGGIIMSSRQYATERAMNRKMKELSKKFNIPMKIEGIMVYCEEKEEGNAPDRL